MERGRRSEEEGAARKNQVGEARRNKREGMSEEEGASRKNRMEEARRNEREGKNKKTK